MFVPVTPYRISLLLAYCEYYTPNSLPGRWLALRHLRTLSAWLGASTPTMTSIRDNPSLAIHLTLAYQAGFLQKETGRWQVMPPAIAWLEQSATEQITLLLQRLADTSQWQKTVHGLGFAKTFPIDYHAYVSQQLGHQLAQSATAQLATWETAAPEEWCLHLPETLPPALWFHLLQLGNWSPGQLWQATPYTIALSALQGYGPNQIEYLLTKATNQPLTAPQQNQLVNWYQRHEQYQIQPVYLLTVKQPEQLDPILTHGSLKKKVQQRIGQRHAIVSPAIVPGLRNWLAKRGIPLQGAVGTPKGQHNTTATELNYLALSVLYGLQQILPLPLPRLGAALTIAQEGLNPEQEGYAQQLTQAVLADVTRAIQGRDAFFPAEQGRSEIYLPMIQKALVTGSLLGIAYQGLTDQEAIWRRIEPIWLETKGELYYLHAYCYQAEAERIFRLDRIQQCDLVWL